MMAVLSSFLFRKHSYSLCVCARVGDVKFKKNCVSLSRNTRVLLFAYLFLNSFNKKDFFFGCFQSLMSFIDILT